MKILVTFATVAVAVGAPFAASAQTYRETIYDLRSESAAPVYNVSDIDRPAYSGGLPPYEVLTIVRSMGFDPQSRPIWRGGVYVVRAFDDQDIPVRVIVDARSGRVVNVAERGSMQDDDGQIAEQRYSSAYPVPPRPVPGDEVYRAPDYRSSEYRGPDYRAPNDRAPDYRSPEYRSPEYRSPEYRSSDTRGYTPAPYAPSTTQSITPHPRVAARTPAQITPTPRTRPATAAISATPAVTTPATPPITQAAVTPSQAAPTTATPKGSATQAATPPAANAAVAQDTSHRGTSIPAPVAARKAETPPAASPAAKPDTPAKSADPSLVPVAPLE